MFEKLCELLLWLYPSGFRETYGRDAIQLMRDRARDERGLVKRLRLLADLLWDAMSISVKGWPAPAPTVMSATAGIRVPSFHIIEASGPKPSSLLAGMMTSMLMFGTFTLLFQAREFRETQIQIGNGPGGEPTAAEPEDSDERVVVVNDDNRRQLMASIALHLRERYVDKAAGKRLAEAVLVADANGRFDGAFMDGELAARISQTIYETGRAIGIPPGVFIAEVVYSDRPIPAGPPPPSTTESRERRRAALLRQSCLYEKAETLPKNIGYVKLSGFADAAVCQDTTARVMASMNNVDALIIDLRDNGGGMGETALQIAGYLFARPTFFFDPRPNTPVPPNTGSPVAGSRLADTPVYVLTSSRTGSAAEYFTYNMKTTRRATIVGERTAGKEHAGAFHRLTDHFGIGIQELTRPDNPFPVKGWEVIGVEPDIPASRDNALEVAMTHVRNRR